MLAAYHKNIFNARLITVTHNEKTTVLSPNDHTLVH